MSTSIPLFLTQDAKQQLRELGHSDQEISQMSPSDGWHEILVTAALSYAKRGWFVFPLSPGEKVPLKGSAGFKDSTRDPATIRGWWAANPLANIGVDCGRSKLAVVDLDVKAGADGPGEWANLKEQYAIDDSQALEQQTPSGGIHLVWHSPNGAIKNSAGKLGPGIDTRGEGGYILVAPSRTAQGSYTWEVSSHPDDHREAPIPAALVDLLRMPASGDPWESAADPENGNGRTIPTEIDDGTRNVTLTSLAGSMRRRGADAEEILAALRIANRKRGNPPLEDHELVEIAESIERYRPDEAPATAPPAGSPAESILLRADASDEGNARCVQALHTGEFLHCEAFGWLTNVGSHWDRELAESELDRAIVDTLIARRVEAARAQADHIVKTTRSTATNVKNTKYLFQSLVPAKTEDFDNFPDLLNCKNGVLNLRTGDLVDHMPGQRFTYCLPIEYDPQANCDQWRGLLLDWVNGDPQLVDYLQMAIGYTLTGHTSEECLFYLYGPTRSGKGTFTETILAMLGKAPLATEVDFSTFTMDRSHDAQNFDLAPLKPCRFVAASESSKYTSLNAGRVKSITGGNEIYCAFKRRTHFAYRPQFKVWLSSNYPANADVDDDAIWYRLQVINFPNSYTGREDKGLKAQLKRTESLQGILAWAVAGAIRWYNQEGTGLRAPRQVREATEQHRLDLDYVGQWLDECIEITGIVGHFVPNSALWLSYSEWCKENGVTPKHKRSLTMELKRKGLDAGQQRKLQGRKDRGCFGIKII